jgi:hypothetical protein
MRYVLTHPHHPLNLFKRQSVRIIKQKQDNRLEQRHRKILRPGIKPRLERRGAVRVIVVQFATGVIFLVENRELFEI